MMFKTPFANKKLALEVSVADDVTIISDKPLLMRALANLLNNAAINIPTGSVRIGLRPERRARRHHDQGDSRSRMPFGVASALNGGAITHAFAPTGTPGTRVSGYVVGEAHHQNSAGNSRKSSPSTTPHEDRNSHPVPAAFAATTRVTNVDALREGLTGWTILDFDQRAGFRRHHLLRLFGVGTGRLRSTY